MERRNGFVCFFQPQGNHYSDSYHHRFILPVLELHTQNILLYLAYFIQHYVHKFPSFFFLISLHLEGDIQQRLLFR